MIDREKLRELAELATPGPWLIKRVGAHLLAIYSPDECPRYEATAFDHRAADYIAAGNPQTMLALLDVLDAAESRIAELEAEVAPKPVWYFDPRGDFTLKEELDDITDGYGIGEVVEIVPVATLPHKYAVWIDDYHLRVFDDPQAAADALAAHKAADASVAKDKHE